MEESNSQTTSQSVVDVSQKQNIKPNVNYDDMPIGGKS